MPPRDASLSYQFFHADQHKSKYMTIRIHLGKKSAVVSRNIPHIMSTTHTQTHFDCSKCSCLFFHAQCGDPPLCTHFALVLSLTLSRSLECLEFHLNYSWQEELVKLLNSKHKFLPIEVKKQTTKRRLHKNHTYFESTNSFQS